MQLGMHGSTAALVLVTSIVLASGLAGCAQRKAVPEPTPVPALLAPVECVGLEDSLRTGRGPRETPSPPEEFVTLTEAEQETVFDILLPAYLPKGVTLQCVRLPGIGWLGESRAVYLIYGGGLTIRQVVATAPPQWPLRSLANDGWVEVEVNGAPGIGHESSDVQAIGGTVHNRGAVTWWAEGITYVVTGDMSLEELLRIAESMQ